MKAYKPFLFCFLLSACNHSPESAVAEKKFPADSLSSINQPQMQAVREPALADNSRNSLDWKGTYKGMLPCADCKGIETVISLNENSFEIKRIFQGKASQPLLLKGNFIWNQEGNKIYCIEANDTLSFLVGENQLFLLDKSGNKIEGSLADKYILRKENLVDFTIPITETVWLLEKLNGKEILLANENQKPLFLKLGAADNRFNAFMGCNNISGAYEIKDKNTIQFSKAMSTMMACENMQTESEFNVLLPKITNYSLNGNKLAFYAKDKLVLNFVAKRNN
jgi:heat shock protein HslJ/uncharacterized lipoprotein NlpE involved in copper resistance